MHRIGVWVRPGPGAAIEKHFDRKQKENLRALKLGAGLDAAMFGRMITGDILARCDAAVHVAHAFTVHSEETESDYFSAVDDLLKSGENEELGSGHIGTVELTSGLFYGYVVIDLPLLMRNLSGDGALALHSTACRRQQNLRRERLGDEVEGAAPHAVCERQPRTRPLSRKGRDDPARERPPLLETPFEVFDRGVFTPNDQFFVRWHLPVIPTSIDVNTFQLRVDGHVRTPIEFTLKEILSQPEVELAAVNQCSGNSRGFSSPRVQVMCEDASESARKVCSLAPHTFDKDVRNSELHCSCHRQNLSRIRAVHWLKSPQ